MERKHQEIDNMIKQKLSALENDSSNESVKRTFTALHKLISDKDQTLFDKISIDMAKAILMQIGIKEEEWFETYIELKEEEMKRNYTLIDIELEKESKGEER